MSGNLINGYFKPIEKEGLQEMAVKAVRVCAQPEPTRRTTVEKCENWWDALDRLSACG